MEFRWNDWNEGHATKHGCTKGEVEAVMAAPGRGYPQKHGGGKWLVEGRGQGGRVIFVIDPDGTIYVIHAMPLARRGR